MTETSLWMIVPGNPGLSALILFVIAMPFLYAARRPVHELVRAVGHLAGGPLRLASKWLLAVAKEMRERNRQVLLSHGRDETEQHIAREFERIGALVRRDLEGYPALQRRLLDEITRVEEDYKKCGEVPPPPPEWVEAVDAVAKVKNGNELVQRVLGEINTSIKQIYDRTLIEYRDAYQSRHKILNGFMPFWRSLERTLAQADKRITSLNDRATQIDAQMAKYQEIVQQTSRAEHVLTISALTQLAVAALVLAIAAGGALINYKLIALPMSEMVGAGDYLTSTLRTSDVAALVIIFVEATMGLFLMETLGITHLFPGIHNLSDQMRKRMMARLRPAGDARRHRGGAGADARHADRRQGGAAAIARDGAAAPAERRRAVAHPDPGADAARLHPAVRAGVCGDPARVVRRLGADRGRGSA